MDTLTFISNLVSSLAWPTAIVSIVLLLRPRLDELIPLMNQFKYGDFEINFSQQMEKLSAEAKKLPQQDTAQDPSKGPLFDDEVYLMAESDPPRAILRAWENVESAAVDAVSRHLVPEDGEVVTNALPFVRWALGSRFLLGSADLETFDNLRSVRNKLAHRKELRATADEAKAYVSLSRKLIRTLEKV